MTLKPISLRIDPAAVNAKARRLLRELDAKALIQRRVKLQASKALLAVSEMRTVAEPQLKTLTSYARDRLTQELRSIEARLLEISKRGTL